MDIAVLSKFLLLLVTPPPSLEVLIYGVLLPNKFSLPCWDLQEVGGTLSGLGLWSLEILHTYKVIVTI